MRGKGRSVRVELLRFSAGGCRNLPVGCRPWSLFLEAVNLCRGGINGHPCTMFAGPLIVVAGRGQFVFAAMQDSSCCRGLLGAGLCFAGTHRHCQPYEYKSAARMMSLNQCLPTTSSRSASSKNSPGSAPLHNYCQHTRLLVDTYMASCKLHTRPIWSTFEYLTQKSKICARTIKSIY